MIVERIHGALAVLWVLLVIPTMLFWKDSIAWVAFMSIYACIGVHVMAWHELRAKRATLAAHGEEEEP